MSAVKSLHRGHQFGWHLVLRRQVLLDLHDLVEHGVGILVSGLCPLVEPRAADLRLLRVFVVTPNKRRAQGQCRRGAVYHA